MPMSQAFSSRIPADVQQGLANGMSEEDMVGFIVLKYQDRGASSKELDTHTRQLMHEIDPENHTAPGASSEQ